MIDLSFIDAMHFGPSYQLIVHFDDAEKIITHTLATKSKLIMFRKCRPSVLQ